MQVSPDLGCVRKNTSKIIFNGLWNELGTLLKPAGTTAGAEEKKL